MSKINNDCFTIGVIGEWGSGKSTIINFAKQELTNKKDLIIIDDFDPWTINSEDALILAMYNTIIENLGKNISYFKRKKVQNALLNVTTDIPYIGKGLGNFFKIRIDDYSEYKEIKADLEEKLKKSKKRLVFIIDNLDRMSKKKFTVFAYSYRYFIQITKYNLYCSL
ncbi:KAP family P-loop domain protein [Parvimonas sp. oral taxon 393 str. F0440]|nr:KAP family P-loop domain protein [Parvimonas sp. oral taxon 393 str. F0440]